MLTSARTDTCSRECGRHNRPHGRDGNEPSTPRENQTDTRRHPCIGLISVGLGTESRMTDWLHSLPLGWMALVVFVVTYIVAAGIYWLVMALAVGERARAFKAISPGMLPPLGIIFGLLVAFIAAQVWGDLDRAHAAVNREASALRAIVLLAASFPGEPETQLRVLVQRQIEDAVTLEWPAMARRRATLTMTPAPLAEALQVSLRPDATRRRPSGGTT